MNVQSAQTLLARIHSGFNPEIADMGNPDGCTYEDRVFIEASTSNGRRFYLAGVDFPVGDNRAERLVEKINQKGVINLELWNEGLEVYGSEAWQIADNFRQLAWDSDPNTQGTVRDI